MELDILDFEDELLGPAFEVAPSLSVCGNIHQARFFPFWEDVLKCGPWHKNILKEGLKLDSLMVFFLNPMKNGTIRALV